MWRNRIALLTAVTALAGLGVAVTDGPPANETDQGGSAPKGKEVTLTGRLVQVKSYFADDWTPPLQVEGDQGTAAAKRGEGTPIDMPGEPAPPIKRQTGQVMMLVTAEGPVLASMVTSAMSARPLQPGPAAVRLRGRLYERSGMKFLAVISAEAAAAVDPPGEPVPEP